MSKRYCGIKSTDLKELLDAIERNISNTHKALLDMIDAGDLTESDVFYCDMIEGILLDLREDLKEIITKEK